MRNHFQSARRWDYIIISVVGSGHRHYIVSNSIDANSLYPIRKNYDSKYDEYIVSYCIPCDVASLYSILNKVDKSGYYTIDNVTNTDSLFVIYNRGDFNR